MVYVVIADDEPHVRALLRMILQPEHQVLEAADGNAALQLIQQHRPAVAILDVSMPLLTGLEVCRRLRADPQTADTAVIIATANGTPADREAAVEAGADHFVTKPFSPATMQQLVAALIAARSEIAG